MEKFAENCKISQKFGGIEGNFGQNTPLLMGLKIFQIPPAEGGHCRLYTSIAT